MPSFNVDSGLDYSGACLTYFAVIFGVCCSWSPISGDYYVHYFADTSKWQMFGLTYAGLVLPTIFVGVLGNYFGGIIASDERLAAIYADGGVGSLMLAVMSPPAAWGRFACILFVLSFRELIFSLC